MKITGSSDPVNSKCEAAALSAPVKTGDQSGVVPSVKQAISAVVSAGPVNPAVNSGGGSGDVNSVKPNKGAPVSSSPGKQVVKTGASSGVRIGVRHKTSVSVGDKTDSYDSSDQAVFFLLGEPGPELTEKNAAELFDHYFEVTHQLKTLWPLPDLNSTGKITVTKIVSPEVLSPVPTPTEIPLDEDDEVDVPSANVVAGSGSIDD
ncbi:replication protein A 70 kDa DNA-binding subunit A-like [Raphanus sativus]|nr:replication protein A 70 kDa DNA-binding subunit A-like [Raphanus sativus]